MLDLVSHPGDKPEPEAQPRRVTAPAHAHAVVAHDDLYDFARANVNRHGDCSRLLLEAEGMNHGIGHRLGDRELQVFQERVWDTVRSREPHRRLPDAGHLLSHGRNAPQGVRR